MSTRRNTWFYALLVAVASAAATLVVSSRLGLSPSSSAQTLGAPPPINSAPITGPVTSGTFRDVATTAMPAVVNIRTESRRPMAVPDNDLFERFFGGGDQSQSPEPEIRERLVPTAGTGFVIDAEGYILTNNHVVEGADRIFVSLYGEESDVEFPAEIVGRDPFTDSALIRLTEMPDHTLPVVRFGDSSQMQPGDWVMAIGNPFNFAHTVSVGVVSALERELNVTPEGDRQVMVLQTDAAINQGNSGGPLLNLRGEVIGINTAIFTGGTQGNIGIGFAVPSNTVRDLLPQLRAGRVTRGRIGVYIGEVQRQHVDEFGLEDRRGAVITRLETGGAASRAGLQPGDVILAFDGQQVDGSDALVRIVTGTTPGATVPVRIMRDQRRETLQITVDELDALAQSRNRPAAERSRVEPAPSSGFGMNIGNITPERARELDLDNRRGVVITSVEQGSPAARALLREGDVIIRVGRVTVNSVAVAGRELDRVPAGGTAFLYVLQPGRGGRQETFVPVTKD
jgi:serine protease Do